MSSRYYLPACCAELSGRPKHRREHEFQVREPLKVSVAVAFVMVVDRI